MFFIILNNIWWIASVLLLLLEIITPATVFIFPALGAVLAGIVSLGIKNIWVQSIVFFGSTVSLLVFVRPILTRNKKNFQSGADALIGKTVLVVETLDEDHGRVKLGADYFPARSKNNQIISKNTHVVVVAIDGIKLIVKEKNHE